MPAITFKPRVKETSTSTGTGNITLAGAVVGYQSFDDAFTVTDDYFHYCIEAVDGNGVPTGQWEEGIGHLSASTTLVRDTLLASSTGSAVSFSAGTKNVFCTVAASFFTEGVDRLLSTTTVDTDTATNQNLYTVPAAKSLVVTRVVFRNAAADISSYVDTVNFAEDGVNETPVDVTTLNTSTKFLAMIPGVSYVPGRIAAAASTPFIRFSDTSINSTLVVDLFGYLY